MTEATYGMPQGSIPCLDCGEHKVKGQKKPMLIYALIDETGEDQEMIAYAKELGVELAGEFAPSTANSVEIPFSSQGNREEVAVLPPDDPGKPPSFGGLKNTMQACMEQYRLALKAGTPRKPDLERWFTYYEKKLKDQL